jgi:hypothetical protein
VERLLRLGVPLLFAILTILPVPQWLRWRAADPNYHVVIVVVSFVVMFAVYDLVVRRTRVTRFLSGIRNRPRP